MDFVWFGDEERILANAPTGRQLTLEMLVPLPAVERPHWLHWPLARYGFCLVWGWETHSGECAYGEADRLSKCWSRCHLPAVDSVWFGVGKRILANAPTGRQTDSRNACQLARRLSGLIGCVGHLPAIDLVWFGDEERILANAPTGGQPESPSLACAFLYLPSSLLADFLRCVR
jgi:hypothetical protein